MGTVMGNIQKFITLHMKNRRFRLIRRQRLMAATLAAIIKRISLTKKLFCTKKYFFSGITNLEDFKVADGI